MSVAGLLAGSHTVHVSAASDCCRKKRHVFIHLTPATFNMIHTHTHTQEESVGDVPTVHSLHELTMFTYSEDFR